MLPLPPDMLQRALYNVMTLYMIALVLRWLGGWLGLELQHGRLKWLVAITDPLLKRVRKIMPPMGPVDFAPIATLFFIWLIRELSVRLVA